MEPADVIADRLHDETQVHDDGSVDLTAAAVETVVDPGRVDFGGGELEPAGTRPVETRLRNPDDDYAWWRLRAGQYRLAVNESIDGDASVLVQPREALLARGADCSTVWTDSLDPLVLSVGGAGLRVKENARVATVVDVRT